MSISVIGAGLAGCEAALAAARRGVPVTLYEMKPDEYTPAHKSPLFAELVCSNSLKAMRVDSAAGLLKKEMEMLFSVCVASAYKSQVPAGGSLSVDREEFSSLVTAEVRSHPLIKTVGGRVDELPEGIVIIATGPLTGGKLAENIKKVCGGEYLSFFDAAAPIVTAESIDMSKAFLASRYGKGGDDYINCPFNKEEYERFHEELISAETAPIKDFDRAPSFYEGCMPIEVMARRGKDSIRFGPLKPVGLRDPATGHRPWAAVQLRRENASGTLFNIVGFQTNLKFPEQKRVFSMIPGLENAEFVRYGVMHRNSFIDSPRLLNPDFSMREHKNIFFAGQISGVEGYMESAASGIVAGINAARLCRSGERVVPPDFTMIGALCRYISDPTVEKFQPMGANFGILPPLSDHIRDKRERYAAFADRSLKWYNDNQEDLL